MPFSFEQLTSDTATLYAAVGLGAVALIAHPFVVLFGNWMKLTRRFANKTGLWIGVMGISAYMAVFFWSQIDPFPRDFFFGSWTVASQSTEILLRSIVPVTGAVSTIAYLVSVIEWLFTKGSGDRGEAVIPYSPRLFLVDKLVQGVLLFATAPAFFLMVRSPFYPLGFDDRTVLAKYVFLWEKSLDTLTLSLLDSFQIQLTKLDRTQIGLPAWNIWLYVLFLTVVLLKVAEGIIRYQLGKRAAGKTPEVAATQSESPP